MDAITRIAVLTPPGAGAIASLAVSGPRAWEATRELFRPVLPERPAPGMFRLGRLGVDDKASDEVVLAVKPDGLELHCHGGLAVVRFIFDLYAARGVVEGSWRDFVSLSPLRAHALALLLQAPTVKTA